MSTETPRAYTEEEVRDMFMNHIRLLIRYWDKESRAVTAKEKLEGLAHSILVTLDGGAMGLPGFKVIPMPHESDKQYHIDIGENYFPEDTDISGFLHEILFKKEI